MVYHGTPRGGFKVFGDGSFFTPQEWYAERYVDNGGTEKRYGYDGGTPTMYQVFLNIRKPFDTRNNKERKIFERDFFRKWGNGTPLSEHGLPDWTDADDLLEFMEENELDYDGIVLDEGADTTLDGGVQWHGESYVPTSPTQIKRATQNNGGFSRANDDITFSMERNLAAAHTLSVDKFLAVAKLGGMPVPSIAITRLDKPYSRGNGDAINLIGVPRLGQPGPGNRVYFHDARGGRRHAGDSPKKTPPPALRRVGAGNQCFNRGNGGIR